MGMMAIVGLLFRATATVAAALCALDLSGPAVGRSLTDTTATAACSPGSASVRLVPRHGPVGTRVRVTGRCFFYRHWDSGYGIFLLREFTKPRECEIIAGGASRFRVDRDHSARGWFKVAADGACFQHRYRRRVTPGLYEVGFGCHACLLARFRVTR
jgi:hypothetical protein